MREPTLLGKAILDLLDKFPEKTSSKIADIAYRTHPDLFNSSESARTIVRYYRNAKGNEARSFKGERREAPESQHVKRLPDVLLLDIETAPIIVSSWTLYKPMLSHENIIEDWFIISWAAKWLYGSEIYNDVVTPKESVNRDDKRICLSIFKLMEKADIIIGHNAIKFDIRKINSRFLINGIDKPSPYQVIDTLLHSRTNFAHSSHRLDYLGRLLVNKEKIKTDHDLWLKCKKGDQESLDYMDKYCQQDVLLLEEVYIEIRGWIKSHPNLALYSEVDQPVCPNCLSERLEFCGEYVTPASVFDSLRCSNCGAISRMRKSKLTPTDKDRLRISVAR